MLNPTEYASLREACKLLPKGQDYRVSDYVRNLLTTVLEFQLRTPTTESAQKHYNKTYEKMIRTHEALCEFLQRYPNTNFGNNSAANDLWNNNCWTRIEFLRALITYFDTQGVCDMKTLRAWAEHTDFHKDIKGKIRTKHHSVGPAIYQWLKLRVGLPTIKADVHVKRFVKKQIGRLPNEEETEEALVRIAREIGYTSYELDSAIWHAQSGLPVVQPANLAST